MADIFILEDLPKAFETAQNLGVLYPGKSMIDLDRSRTILGLDEDRLQNECRKLKKKPETAMTYREIYTHLDSDMVSGELILILDLKMEEVQLNEKEYRQIHKIPDDIESDFLAGICLAAVAIKNPNIKKLYIYVSSRFGAFRNLFLYFENLIRETGLPYRKFYTKSDTEIFKSPEKARFILDTIHREWEKHFVTTPVAQFVDKMEQRTGVENHNWGTKKMPPQFGYLAEFLDFEPGELARGLKIIINHNDYRFHTLTGECLKVFGTKKSEFLPMLGLLFVAWAVYRREINKKMDYLNTQFMRIISELEEKYFQLKNGGDLLKEDSEKVILLKKLAKKKNLLPDQDRYYFKDTLNTLYEMFKLLFKHESNPDRSILQKVRFVDGKFELFIEITNPDFFEKLNEKVSNLLIHQSLTQNQTTSKIIEFWLKSNSSIIRKEEGEKPTGGIDGWGNHSNLFYFDKRNGSGITLVFRL